MKSIIIIFLLVSCSTLSKSTIFISFKENTLDYDKAELELLRQKHLDIKKKYLIEGYSCEGDKGTYDQKLEVAEKRALKIKKELVAHGFVADNLTAVAFDISNRCKVGLRSYEDGPAMHEYPHWNFLDKQEMAKLIRIDKFIKSHAWRGELAIFDWDGTLYEENITIEEKFTGATKGPKAGQPVWHTWAANNYTVPGIKKLNLFPAWRNEDGDGPLYDLIKHDDYLEKKTNLNPIGYDKFRQIAIMESGMTPKNMAQGISYFLRKYNPSKLMFYKVFDVLQSLLNNGFKVWIVTGSNPYYVAPILAEIDHNHNGELSDRFRSKFFEFRSLSASPYIPSNLDGSRIYSRIIGNSAKVVNGKFNNAYDDRYIPYNKYKKIYAVMTEGKRIAVEDYIEKYDGKGKKAVFCAGNSGGDYQMMEYVLKKSVDSMGLIVNGRGKIKEFMSHDRVINITVDSQE
jgi:phosphoserine phosphatase